MRHKFIDGVNVDISHSKTHRCYSFFIELMGVATPAGAYVLGGHTGGFNSGIGQLHSGIGFLQFIRRVKRVRFYFNRTPVRLGGLRGGIGNVSDLTFKTFFGKASTFYGCLLYTSPSPRD